MTKGQINLKSAFHFPKPLESLVLQGFAGLIRSTLQVQLRKPAKLFATSPYRGLSKPTTDFRSKKWSNSHVTKSDVVYPKSLFSALNG